METNKVRVAEHSRGNGFAVFRERHHDEPAGQQRAHQPAVSALDCGFVVSWVSFLCQDMICKRFGAKASIKISILALLVTWP